MPITKCSASKATPAKGIAYIMDPEKVIARGSQGFATSDPKQMARQMLQTMHLYGKGFDYDERKYYHTKIAFDPKDRVENGGTLTKEKAAAYAAKYAAKNWPGREVVWAVQDHGASIHIHFIVAACERDTGKKLDARDAEYRQWKDRAQEMAKEYGLSTLDWRKATREKRARENQGEFPDNPTFAEQGLRERGKSAWKDELREIIDLAAITCSSMEEFREQLQANGVTLTRCSDTVISYKLGDHKACRGDTLGADYTVEAIRDSLAHNHEPDPTRTGSVDDIIAGASAMAAGVKPVSLKDRQTARELGRLAGVPRNHVDEMCDHAPKATWDEKKEIWDFCSNQKDSFWLDWNVRRKALDDDIKAKYRQRQTARAMEWALDERNRKAGLLEVLVAFIYLRTHDTVWEIDYDIQRLKEQKQELRSEASQFKINSAVATATLRQKGLTVDEYMSGIKTLQEQAEEIREKNEQMLSPEELLKRRKKQEREQEKQRKKMQKQAPAWKPKENKPKKSWDIDR